MPKIIPLNRVGGNWPLESSSRNAAGQGPLSITTRWILTSHRWWNIFLQILLGMRRYVYSQLLVALENSKMTIPALMLRWYRWVVLVLVALHCCSFLLRSSALNWLSTPARQVSRHIETFRHKETSCFCWQIVSGMCLEPCFWAGFLGWFWKELFCMILFGGRACPKDFQPGRGWNHAKKKQGKNMEQLHILGSMAKMQRWLRTSFDDGIFVGRVHLPGKIPMAWC